MYFKNGQIHFYGVIAARKILKGRKSAALYIGVGPQQYTNLFVDKWYGKYKTVIIKGVGTGTKEAIQVENYQLI